MNIQRDETLLQQFDVLREGRPARLYQNLSPSRLVAMSVSRGETELSADGALVAHTGKFTGRSPNDKYVVEHSPLTDDVDWTANRPLDTGAFRYLRSRALKHMRGREFFVQDLYAGADHDHRLKVRVITEQAWHALFARNMFIRPPQQDLPAFEPDWTVLQLPSFDAYPEVDGTNSSTVIAIDLVGRMVLIVGTAYAGEIKKSIFTVLNHLLPAKRVMPMHCSANVGGKNDSALFFGLSGTGKTTLSADSSRTLIGDDEHGWGANGIFNFEGGCYAKVIKLDPAQEPEIWNASNRFGSVLENVILDPITGQTDFDDGALTENTRSCYPLDFIPNASATGRADHPKNIVMLTADAFGVLPPISLLTPEQAMYHFLSGYTAKVAGTERGVSEPQATFSACFGAPFLLRHPSCYAGLLGEMLRKHDVRCWLVNTGWTGGAFGTGKRMPLAATRALLNAALDGDIQGAEMTQDDTFGLRIPQSCAGVEPSILNPRQSWADKAAYDHQAQDVAMRFGKNFERFTLQVDSAVQAAAMRVAG